MSFASVCVITWDMVCFGLQSWEICCVNRCLEEFHLVGVLLLDRNAVEGLLGASFASEFVLHSISVKLDFARALLANAVSCAFWNETFRCTSGTPITGFMR